MKKIPTLFVRNPDDRRYVTDEVTPGCEWVLAGEGVATRKYDGTCVMLDDEGNWWARREVKPGKTPPPNWVEADHDEITGKRMGWEPIAQSSFAKFWNEARGAGGYARSFTPGTYELCGPKVNGNPEGYDEHRLIAHSTAEAVWFPLEPDAALIAHTVRNLDFEGVVWHHPDGRMAKLKARDFPEKHDPAAVAARGGVRETKEIEHG
jgi:hypothetical protein